MFETVVPETVSPRRRSVFFATLPVSIAVHVFAVAAAVFSATWNVAFPSASPKLYAAYSLTASPPPPPPPPPPPRRTGPAESQPHAIRMPLVAPAVIPDLIPEVRAEPAGPREPVAEPAAPASDGVEGGVDGGVEGGVIGGLIGGTVGGLIGGPAPDVVHIRRDEPLPVGAISQEYPAYPEYARSRGWEDTLVVRYVIGKDGRVKDVSVVSPPEREEFIRPTLNTIRHWRFHPLRDENGEPKEVSHELTVEFRIKRVRR